MASFAEIMGQAERENRGITQNLPFVPGMPQGQVQPQAPQLAQVPPMQGQAPAQGQAQPQGGQPPANPEEFEQRRQGWTQVLGEFMKQPNAKQVMMMVGLKLLQGREPGQSLGQQFGGALGTGVMANSMLQQNQVEAQEKLRKQQMEDEKHGLDMRRGTALADKAEAENDFYSKTRTQAIEEIELGIKNLKLRGEVEQAKLVEQQFQNGNLKEAWELAKRDKQNAIWARTEQVKTGRLNAEKVPTAQQKQKELEDLVRRANPQQPGEDPAAYDQRVAQATLGMQGTSKSNSAADWTKYADSLEEGPERDHALAQAKAILEGRKLPAAPPPAGDAAATGRGGTGPAPITFPTMEAFNAAAAAGKLKDGTRVLVNGRSATYRAK